jgi:hypothetical protein
LAVAMTEEIGRAVVDVDVRRYAEVFHVLAGCGIDTRAATQISPR